MSIPSAQSPFCGFTLHTIEAILKRVAFFNLQICYNIANIKNIEFGVFTDFDSIGIDAGYRWRNIVPFVGYTLDGDVHFGVSFKIF